MPLKYFGYKTLDFGRPLWEIVLNLKNFGKGRLVVRSKLEREFSEPTFYKILSVHPHVIEYPENQRGNIYTEMVFRGRRKTDPVDLADWAFRSDFRLVHKEDEQALYQKLKEFEAKPQRVLILPRTAPLPPLWKEILAREKKINPESVPEIPLLHTFGDPDIGVIKRLAEEGEEPTFRTGPGNFKPIHPEFFETVIWSREEAREKFCTQKPDPDFIYLDKKLTPMKIKEQGGVK